MQKNVQIPLQKHPGSISKMGYKRRICNTFGTNLEHFFTFYLQTHLQRILVGEDKTLVETVPIMEKLKNPQSIAKVLQKCSYTVGTNPYIL